MALCLIVEDDSAQRQLLGATLRTGGYEVGEANSGHAALAFCAERQPEVVLLDLGLPDGNGIDLIPGLLRQDPLARIVVLTGDNSVAAAVKALRAGARHYLVKPWETDELLVVVEREARAVDAEELQRRGEPGQVFWGAHRELLQLRRQIEKIALSPLTPVLIEGETGSGKEVVARELHRRSAAPGLFVALNCAAIPSELLESELFGHERGAFTGATVRRRGCVELARDGTLFLDEIGEMAPALQSKLLGFLHNRRFRRVGGEEELCSENRVVAATHRDLESLLGTGQFREDLFYRLAVVRLRVPPLRERREDLLPLAYFLLGELASRLGRPPLQLSAAAETAVLAHPWPGNVRELRNRLERAMVLAECQQLGPVDLDLLLTPRAAGPAAQETELARVRAALEAEGWNVSHAARRLGVARHWLRYRMRRHGLSERAG